MSQTFIKIDSLQRLEIHTKFGFYQLQSFLFIVVMVTSILLKTRTPLSRLLKNIGMASEKLYRNTLIGL